MKRVVICMLALFCFSSIVYAQGTFDRPEYDPTKANGTPGQDDDFLQNAMNQTSAEIEWSKIAAQKSTNPDVKALASETVDNETSAAQHEVSLARALSVKPPNGLSGKEKKESDKLRTMSGPDFDKEYLTALEKVEHLDLDNMQQEAQGTKRPELKNLASTNASRDATRNEKTKALRKQLTGK